MQDTKALGTLGLDLMRYNLQLTSSKILTLLRLLPCLNMDTDIGTSLQALEPGLYITSI